LVIILKRVGYLLKQCGREVIAMIVTKDVSKKSKGEVLQMFSLLHVASLLQLTRVRFEALHSY